MAGVVRRKQEKPGRTGEKFAFVTLSDPTGEYEVLFPPETCGDAGTSWNPARRWPSRCGPRHRGRVRFFGDDAEPVEKAIENITAGLRVHLSPRSAEIEALKQRLEGVVNRAAARSCWWPASATGARWRCACLGASR